VDRTSLHKALRLKVYNKGNRAYSKALHKALKLYHNHSGHNRALHKGLRVYNNGNHVYSKVLNKALKLRYKSSSRYSKAINGVLKLCYKASSRYSKALNVVLKLHHQVCSKYSKARSKAPLVQCHSSLYSKAVVSTACHKASSQYYQEVHIKPLHKVQVHKVHIKIATKGLNQHSIGPVKTYKALNKATLKVKTIAKADAKVASTRL
jgi:hypothetical protein